MSKGKSITLLSIICVLMAAIIALTFVRFQIGLNVYNSALGAIELDYDIEGGAAYTYSLTKDNENEIEDINEVIETLEYRLDALGYGAYNVKAIKSADAAVKDYDIRLEVKNSSSTSADMDVVMKYGVVKFYGGTSANPTEEILADMDVVKSAEYLGATTDGTSTYYQVAIEFTDAAYEELMSLIESAESSYYVEIKIEDTVLLQGSSAISKDYFQNKTLAITSSSEDSAKQMALQMASGGLEYKYKLENASVISSPYGENVDTKVAIAIGAFFLVIICALIVMYKGMGIISSLAMILFMIIEVWMLIAVPGITLSMGGVMGIVLATALAACGMFIICNRIKEEYANSEKTVRAAVAKGFRQSLIPIVNLNVVAGIVALSLLALTDGVVKCFAITLGIGAAASLLAGLFFTRMFSELLFPLAKNKDKFLGVKRSEVK